jgi:gluconate 2-dehydrogenase alpha chain
MTQKLHKTDVVIIGLGAAGSVAALELSKRGLEVIGLEAGPWRTIKDFPSDEIRNDIRNYMGNPKMNQEIPTSRMSASDTAQPTVGGALMMNGVGGSTTHYTCQTWRFLPWNFKMKSETLKRYGPSMIPKDSLVEDWPVTYDDLEPYYDKVEYEIGVSGRAGNIKGRLTGQGNDFEGPRQRDYPLPPLRWSGYNELAFESAKKVGWHPFRMPAAIHSEPYRGNPACQYCGFCTQNGCHTNAKGSTFLNAIPDAQKTGKLKVRTGARVVEIVIDRNGRAAGVNYISGGQLYFQPASLVIVSSYVYENNRLLLLSKSHAFPHGLSNNHGWVGKGYMSHGFVIGYAHFDGRKLNRFSGPGAQGVCLDDWDADNFDHRELAFIGGGDLETTMEAKPIATARAVPPSVKQQWGAPYKQFMKRNAISIATNLAQMDVLPYEENTIDLDPTHKDPQGYPVARITFAYKEQEQKRYQFLLGKQRQWFQAMGATETWGALAYLPVNQHVYGGTRMGTAPDNSVVDGYQLSHEVPNLAIMGGSTFPNTGGRNPTETIQALAWRGAEHIAANWKSIAA